MKYEVTPLDFVKIWSLFIAIKKSYNKLKYIMNKIKPQLLIVKNPDLFNAQTTFVSKHCLLIIFRINNEKNKKKLNH